MDQNVAPLLRRVPADKQEHGIHWAPALVPLCVPGPIVFPLHVDDRSSMDAIVDHGHIATVCATTALALLLEHSGDRNQLVSRPASATFNVLDARVAFCHVSIAAALRRVHGEDAFLALPLQLLDARACQPVVAMDDVKGSPDALVAIERRHKGTAHVPDVLDHVTVLVVSHLMVMDPKDFVVHGVTLGSSEDVHLVTCSMQCRRELCDVRGDATHRYGVQCLPSQHCDLEGSLAGDDVLGALNTRQDALTRTGKPGLRNHIEDLFHCPVFVTALQHLPVKPCGSAALAEVEAKAASLNRHAEAREEGGLVRNRRCNLAHPLALLVHNGSCQPKVANRDLVCASGLLEVLVELCRLLRQPPATMGVYHRRDAREVEPVHAILGHPEGEAGEKIPLHFLILILEDAATGDRICRLRAIPEVLVAEAVA
mmetsp:Transcript_99586/g.264671  ORF Transcript_99586/g.264671 Transcript_99586/m.264671 type:complete len:427 (-) Transcript_99586:260-1540(-)